MSHSPLDLKVALKLSSQNSVLTQCRIKNTAQHGHKPWQSLAFIKAIFCFVMRARFSSILKAIRLSWIFLPCTKPSLLNINHKRNKWLKPISRYLNYNFISNSCHCLKCFMKGFEKDKFEGILKVINEGVNLGLC